MIRWKSWLLALFFALAVPACGLMSGAQSTLLFRDFRAPSMIGEFVMGSVIFIGGIWRYGPKKIGLAPSATTARRLGYLLLPLVAMMLLGVVGTPISALDLSKLDLTRIIVTGFWEEILFRGFCLAAWIRLFGFETPVSRIGFLVLSNLAFGLLHNNEGMALVLRFGLGLMFAMVVIKTHAVVFVMIMHTLYNGLVAVLGGSAGETVNVVGILLLSAISVFIVLKAEDFPGSELTLRADNLAD